MKKIFLVFAIAGSIVACNSNDSKTGGSGSTSGAPAAAADPSEDPVVKKGLSLVAGNDCFGCHHVTAKVTGPAYMEVADKYRGQGEAIQDTLAQRIIKGSTGHWGATVMTPHPNLSEDDARTMVKYVLSLQK